MTRERLRRGVFIAVVTAALTFAFVLRAHGEWVWDDVLLVEHNRRLVEAGGLRSILTQDLYASATGEPTQLFHPVPMALLWLEAHVFGVAVAPMRLVNVVLHTLNGALLFVYLRRRLAWSELAAQVATAVFLLHPSTTEPVMWLTGLHDLIGVAFVLGALLVFDRRWSRAALATLLCALAFLSKEMFVVAPVLLVLEPARRRAWHRAMGLPFAAVPAVFLLRHALGISSSSDAAHATLAAQVRAAGTIVAHYAAQLASFSNGRTTERFEPLSLGAASAVLGAYVLAIAVAASRRSPAAPALAWIAVALAPNLLSLPIIGMFGNRYAYLPLVGFAWLLAYGATLVERALHARSESLERLASFAPAAAACLLALSTAGEASQWKSAVTLFGADVDRAPNDPRALYHYGHAVYVRQGCAAALPFYERAVAHDPAYQRAWHNVAGCLINEHRYAEAVPPAESALALAPDDARAEYNLGVALVQAGRRAEGLAHLERARALAPSSRPIADALESARR